MKEFKYTKYLVFTVAVLVFLVIITHAYSVAKYTSNAVFSYYLNSKGFYFESDSLAVDDKNNIDTMWDGENVYFTLTNSKSSDLTSSFDIEYTVSCSMVDENTNKKCFVNGSGHSSYVGTLSASFGCVDKKGSKDVGNLDEAACTENEYSWVALPSTSRIYFNVFDQNGGEVDNAKVKITVSAKKPYTKTMSATYTLIRSVGLIGGLNLDYKKGNTFDDVIVSNSYSEDKCVKLTWDSSKYLIKSAYTNKKLVDENGNVNGIMFELKSMNSKKYEFYRVDNKYEYNLGDFSLVESNECN